MFIETTSVFAPFLPSCRGVDRFFLFELLPNVVSTSSDPVRIRTAIATLPVLMSMSSSVSWLSTACRGVKKKREKPENQKTHSMSKQKKKCLKRPVARGVEPITKNNGDLWR